MNGYENLGISCLTEVISFLSFCSFCFVLYRYLIIQAALGYLTHSPRDP